MKAPLRRSVIPEAEVLVEEWEKAAAGLEKEDALAPAAGVLLALALSVPFDVFLLWVLLWHF